MIVIEKSDCFPIFQFYQSGKSANENLVRFALPFFLQSGSVLITLDMVVNVDRFICSVKYLLFFAFILKTDRMDK